MATIATGRSVTYWTKPDRPLCELDRQQRSGRPPHRGRRIRAAQHEHCGDGQPQQQHHEVGVELAQGTWVETVAWRVDVACVRPAAGDDGADVQHQPADAEDRPDQPADPRGHQGAWRFVALAESTQQDHCQTDHGERDEQVEGDDPGVQVGQHRDAADERLGGDAEGQQERQAYDGPAAVAPGEHERRDGDSGDQERDHAVAELDRAVDAHRAVRDERRSGAARPLGAAESGAGEPDDPAGDDDADVGDQRRDRSGPHPGEGPRRRGPVRGDPLAHAHSHWNVRAVRTVPIAAHTASTSSCVAGEVAVKERDAHGTAEGAGRQQRQHPTAAAVRAGREDHGPAGHQQQVDEVGDGQRRLGAQRAGDEQAERGEGGRAEQHRGEDAEQADEATGSGTSRAAARRRR